MTAINICFESLDCSWDNIDERCKDVSISTDVFSQAFVEEFAQFIAQHRGCIRVDVTIPVMSGQIADLCVSAYVKPRVDGLQSEVQVIGTSRKVKNSALHVSNHSILSDTVSTAHNIVYTSLAALKQIQGIYSDPVIQGLYDSISGESSLNLLSD